MKKIIMMILLASGLFASGILAEGTGANAVAGTGATSVWENETKVLEIADKMRCVVSSGGMTQGKSEVDFKEIEELVGEIDNE